MEVIPHYAHVLRAWQARHEEEGWRPEKVSRHEGRAGGGERRPRAVGGGLARYRRLGGMEGACRDIRARPYVAAQGASIDIAHSRVTDLHSPRCRDCG